MKELKSKYTGGDFVPVLIVGAIYGIFFALIVREVAGGWHRAEVSDLIEQSIRLGGEFQKEVDEFRKKTNGKKESTETGRKKSGAKVRRHDAEKKA